MENNNERTNPTQGTQEPAVNIPPEDTTAESSGNKEVGNDPEVCCLTRWGNAIDKRREERKLKKQEKQQNREKKRLSKKAAIGAGIGALAATVAVVKLISDAAARSAVEDYTNGLEAYDGDTEIYVDQGDGEWIPVEEVAPEQEEQEVEVPVVEEKEN